MNALQYKTCYKRFVREKEINQSQQECTYIFTILNLYLMLKHCMNTNVCYWCWLSGVDWDALCCRQLCGWVFMPWKMKRPVQEMTSASRIHRLDSLLLLSALFTLHTWAGIQINLQCCHRMLNTLVINILFFSLPAARWGGYVRSKISRSPETFPACVHVDCTVLSVPAVGKSGHSNSWQVDKK